jgi:RNA polymerase sigma factor (sigma-70 family)
MKEISKQQPITVEEIRSKDPKVFGRVYSRVIPIMERAAEKIVSTDQVPDIAHDALLKVLNQAEKGKLHEESLEGYFVTAARTTALDVLRREKRRKDLLGRGKDPVDFDSATGKETTLVFPNPSSEVETTEESTAEVELFRRIEKVVEDRDQFAALYLDYKGFSSAEIGDLLGVVPQTVRTRIHRGKNKIKQEAEIIFGDAAADIPEREKARTEKKQRKS